VSSKNLVIECDGEYWHDRKPGAKAKDARKDAYLLSKGYSILRLPEIEIKSGNFNALLEILAQ
jgi:very-short-patch-repair endonuclease